MQLRQPKKLVLKVGREYEVQGRFCVLVAVEGSTVVVRDRFDNQFECDIGYVREKPRIAKPRDKR